MESSPIWNKKLETGVLNTFKECNRKRLASLLDEPSITTDGLTGGGGIGRTWRIIQSGRTYKGFKPNNSESSSLILLRTSKTWKTCKYHFDVVHNEVVGKTGDGQKQFASRITYRFCRKYLFPFYWFSKLFSFKVFLRLSFVFCNHIHALNGDLGLLSTTTTRTLINWLFGI